MALQRSLLPMALLFSWLLMSTAASVEPPIAKAGCPARCGDVEIPFPFGIGKGCYADVWFQVSCIKNTVPLLNRTKLEVTEISVDGTLKVKNPITFSNCSGKVENRQSPNLEGSPFVLSQKSNRFTAVGCGAIALMTLNSSITVAGCFSICGDDTAIVNKSCNGMDCCQTTIPLSLTAFTTSFRTIEADQKSVCRYAFIADQ